MFSKLLLIIFSMALAACNTPPQKPLDTIRGDHSYTKQYLTWLIEKEMDDANITGLSIALVDDQEIVLAQGFGYADKQAKIQATPDTVYNVGSIAKVFTATAAMQLQEEGQLNIDRALQYYLPEFSIKSRFGDTQGITPRNIMTHHSGLPSNWLRGMTRPDPEPFTAVVTAVKDEYTAYPPDYIFAYSNLGVTLLGVTISKVSGEDYASYMANHLLRPLGMTRSMFTSSIPGKGYNAGKEVAVVPLRDVPAGGLNSTASDIAHFLQMVFADGKYNGKQILQPDSLREMFRVQNANVPMDFDFKMGLGWMLSGLDIQRAGTVANHGGTTLNFHSFMAVLPEHKLGVVVLSNSATGQGVVSNIAAEALKIALEAKRGIVQPEKMAPKAVQVTPLTADDIRMYEGYFDTLIGLVKVSGKSGKLTAEIMGQKLELLPREDKQFGVRFKLFGFIPVKINVLEEVSLSLHNIAGRDVLALKSNGQSMLIGEKLQPVAIPPSLLDFAGEYEILNQHDGTLPDRIEVRYLDGLLVGEFTLPEKPGFVFRTAFKPVADDEVVMMGLGSGKSETVHFKIIDGEEHIFFSGMELRKKRGKRT